MDKIRVALCGCYGHVKKFGRLINSFPESEVVVVWDNIPGRGEDVAESLGCAFDPDYEHVITSYNLNAVAIISENALHCEMVVRAAEAGLHVFLEKPMCVNAQEARTMRDAIQRNNVKFYLSDPFIRTGSLGLKRLVDSGVLGEITGATFQLGTGHALRGWVNYDKSKAQGGIMADIGEHMVHKAHYLFGKPAQIMSGFSHYTDKAKENDIEEHAIIVMRYPDGKLVSLDCNWMCGAKFNIEQVYGTKGWANVTMIGPEEGDECLTYQIGKEPEVKLFREDLPENPKTHVRYWIDMIVKNIPNTCVGVDPLSNSGVGIDAAVEHTEMIEAIYRSRDIGFVSLD